MRLWEEKLWDGYWLVDTIQSMSWLSRKHGIVLGLEVQDLVTKSNETWDCFGVALCIFIIFFPLKYYGG